MTKDLKSGSPDVEDKTLGADGGGGGVKTEGGGGARPAAAVADSGGGRPGGGGGDGGESEAADSGGDGVKTREEGGGGDKTAGEPKTGARGEPKPEGGGGDGVKTREEGGGGDKTAGEPKTGARGEPEAADPKPQAGQPNIDDLAIRKKFNQSPSHNNSIIDNFLKFNSTIDKILDELTKDQELNKKLIKNLKDSADPLYVELREYILDHPEVTFINDFKKLKEASAIGVLVTSQETGEIKHSYEAREQAVNFLCYRGEDNKYEIKDEYKQDKDKDKDKDIDTALLQLGIKCFKDDEDKLFTKSPSFKGFKDFENGIKPILSFFPPLQTALSALGPLLLGERELSGTIHGIRFRPSDYSTKTTVEKIEKTSQILLK